MSKELITIPIPKEMYDIVKMNAHVEDVTIEEWIVEAITEKFLSAKGRRVQPVVRDGAFDDYRGPDKGEQSPLYPVK
jgi:hypothetical protein